MTRGIEGNNFGYNLFVGEIGVEKTVNRFLSLVLLPTRNGEGNSDKD